VYYHNPPKKEPIAPKLEKFLEDFFEVYAIEFKNNALNLPSSVVIEYEFVEANDGMYETEDGDYEYSDESWDEHYEINRIKFFDENQNTIKNDFFIEIGSHQYRSRIPINSYLISYIENHFNVTSLFEENNKGLFQIKNGI